MTVLLFGHFSPIQQQCARPSEKKPMSMRAAQSQKAHASPRPDARGPAAWRALPHAQATTWAWAGISASRPIPPGLRLWPDQLRPSIQIERWSTQLGASKTPAGRASFNPSFILSSPSLSSRRAPEPQRSRPWRSEGKRSTAPPWAPSLVRALPFG